MSDTDRNDSTDPGSGPDEEFDPFADSGGPCGIPARTAEAREEGAEGAANPMERAADEAETRDAKSAAASLSERPPVFEYAGAAEEIAGAEQTFDELRIAKSADFPELEDGKRVSWTVEYGKISKPVGDPKGTSIAKAKADIEASREFLDALKKAKDKNPPCKIRPKVTAQSKGGKAAYKGVFASAEDALASGKAICLVPGRDGLVYEIRKTPAGVFSAPSAGSEALSDIRAGVGRTLPLVPKELLLRAISFFRKLLQEGGGREGLLNLYWDTVEEKYLLDEPVQEATGSSVRGRPSEEYACERYVHYMDIHSHGAMAARFSATDDADEKATRLYAVVGRLDKALPHVRTRISCGGRHVETGPEEAFEPPDERFSEEWEKCRAHREYLAGERRRARKTPDELMYEIAFNDPLFAAAAAYRMLSTYLRGRGLEC